MLGVISKANSKDKRVFHKMGCIYARRIKEENRREMSTQQAAKRHICSCKYCGGFAGDVRVHKKAFKTWERKYHMKFTYRKNTDTLYIQTENGFWKAFMKPGEDKYLLYHRNTFNSELSAHALENGEFHRQSDVKATESLEKFVDYIDKHDKAKKIISIDYRMLPQTTKKQKKYYRSAERKAKRHEARRLDMIFLALEQGNQEFRKLSFC